MDVTGTIAPAFEHMKRLLFRPINVGTWFSFGLIFFLQSCAENGGGAGDFAQFAKSNGPSHRNDGGGVSYSSLLHAFDVPTSPLRHGSSSDDVATIAIVLGILFGVPLIVLMLWLGARGQMMAIRAVATGYPDVSGHWRETEPAATSLFKTHLALVGIMLLSMVPFGGSLLFIVHEQAEGGIVWVLLGVTGLLILFVMTCMAVLSSLNRNFVAPIMLKKGIGYQEAFRDFRRIASGNWGRILLFWLLRWGFAIAAGFLSLFVMLFTCCLGMLPVVHQALMAPYYAFERAHSLHVLASLGAEYNLIDLPDAGGFGGDGGGYGAPSLAAYGGSGGGHGYGGPGAPPPAGGFGGYPPRF